MANRLLLKKLEEIRKQQLEIELERSHEARRDRIAARRDRRWLKAGVLIAGISAMPSGVAVNSVGYLSYAGGFVLAAAGVVGLKQHVENPGQNPMKKSLAELGFSGILLNLPPVVGAIPGNTSVSSFGTDGFSSFSDDSI